MLELIDNQIVQTTGTIRLRTKFPKEIHLRARRAHVFQ
jgi:hypothetical protein